MKTMMKTRFNTGWYFISAFILAVSLFSCKKLIEETVCLPPATLNVKGVTDTSATFEWPAAQEAEQYIVKVVASGQSWNGALEKRTTGSVTSVTFDNLQPGLNYLVKVQSNCPGSNSDFTAEFPFSTLTAKVFDISKKWRISKLQSNGINLVLQSGDYAEFIAPDVYNQMLLGASSNGSWSLAGPAQDTLILNTGASRKYRIRALSAGFFRGVGMGNISGDTLELSSF
jgi:hypothetical protein